MSELVWFAVVAIVLVWPYQATNPPVSIFASEAHAAEIANDCTASDVPQSYTAWCGTFTGNFFADGGYSGSYSGLMVTRIVRWTDGSIIPHGVYRWANKSVSLRQPGRSVVRLEGSQMTIEHPNGGKSTFTLQDDGSIHHWYCRNKKKRCLLGSRMALLQKTD